jgi:basic membrane protein A
MKKLLSCLMVLFLLLGVVACTSTPEEKTDTPEETVYKVGLVCIGDDNAAYDRNFYMAAEDAKEVLASKGINIEWHYTYNHPEGDPVAVDNEELAEEGCIAIFNNSYGQEPAMLTVAGQYPDTIFAGLTNEHSSKDDLPNTINAFPSVYEGRYIAGVVAGLKLNELIEAGTITPEQAVIGYVGAYTFAEVISGYTAYYLGAKSVCPSVSMMVEFIGSWSNPSLEQSTAQDLIDRGAIMVSQHSDSTTPATTAQAAGVFHTGSNIDMTDVAPDASIISTRIDWTNFFVYVIECAVNGTPVDQDYIGHGLKDGDVKMTALNEAVAAEGTAEKIAEVEAQLASGELQVFDTSKFTVNGEEVTTCFALDTDGDFVADSEEAVFDGAFHESYFQSAPYFALRIDGITLINEAY